MAVNATVVWRARPGGNNTNGGGYDSGIASAGTDYSQQNSAQVTQSGGTVSTATVTLTDTGASFTPALIGNGIRVSGTGITSPFYTFITAVPSGTTLTLQDSPGTTGTSVTYSIGGGWADYWTNTNTTINRVVPGNTVYILGSGTPNPSSYTYDYIFAGGGAGGVNLVSGDTTNGYITYANDPATPGYKAPPDTTGGMPVTKVDGRFIAYPNGYVTRWLGLWLVSSNTLGGATNGLIGGYQSTQIMGCVYDQFGFPFTFATAFDGMIAGCEIFSSTGGGSGANAIICGNSLIANNNIHDCVCASNNVIVTNQASGTKIINNIIAKNTSVSAIDISQPIETISGNTIDGNGGHGLNVAAGNGQVKIYNNIISNQTDVGAYAINFTSGTAAANTRIMAFCDYNVFYNNTANYNAINAGPHDTALVSDPYVGRATENYALA